MFVLKTSKCNKLPFRAPIPTLFEQESTPFGKWPRLHSRVFQKPYCSFDLAENRKIRLPYQPTWLSRNSHETRPGQVRDIRGLRLLYRYYRMFGRFFEEMSWFWYFLSYAALREKSRSCWVWCVIFHILTELWTHPGSREARLEAFWAITQCPYNVFLPKCSTSNERNSRETITPSRKLKHI